MNWLENFKKEKMKRCQKVLVANKRDQNKALLKCDKLPGPDFLQQHSFKNQAAPSHLHEPTLQQYDTSAEKDEEQK